MQSRSFPASRGISIVLFCIGATFAILLLIGGRVDHSWVFFCGVGIVILWGIRALNIGSRWLWIGIWTLSILWHAAWTYLGIAGIYFGFGILREYVIFAALPLWWVATVLFLSVGSLITDWNLPHTAQRSTASTL